MTVPILILAFLGDVSDGPLLRRVMLEVDSDTFYMGLCRDIASRGNTLFILENQEHRVQIVSLRERNTYLGSLVKKGEGPGETWLPSQVVSAASGEILISDNRGISIFDPENQFSDRFRVYTPRISMCHANDSIYFATIRPEQAHLVDVYTMDGERKGAFFDKFLEVGSSRGQARDLARNERYLYRGDLLTDQTHLYYLNAPFGRLWKMDLSGKIIDERDLSKAFGPRGRFILDKNQAYLDDPALLEAPDGFITYPLYKDACLVNDKIYLLRWVDPDPLFESEIKDILVFDTNSLTLVEKLHFRMEKGEFIHAFIVLEQDGKRRIITTMETNQDPDIRLVEWR